MKIALGTLSLLFLCIGASGQASDPVARIFHPSGALPSYEVDTVKPTDPSHPASGQPLRAYILNAYRGDYALSTEQLVGGPEWINQDNYTIAVKPPAEQAVAMKNMLWQQQAEQNRMMMQSLLADRFHLKLHVEVRTLPVYALVPAKDGLKITAVPAPTALGPPDCDPQKPTPAGRFCILSSNGSDNVLRALAVTMQAFIAAIRLRDHEFDNHPWIDQTGFTGYFNISRLRWQKLGDADSISDTDAPSLSSALQETLGIKFVQTKGPVEVLVIDSIDRPSEN
ncbi:MAG TPA: TIGR03435 family protein [Acidobacteriaceae bacterium]